MQSVQPDSPNPIALRQSAHGVGTLLFRFVGLLTAAVVVIAVVSLRFDEVNGASHDPFPPKLEMPTLRTMDVVVTNMPSL